MTTQQATAEATNKSAPAVPPRGIGPYKIIGRLGKGGMAEVLLAMQHDSANDFKRLVVVKRVLTELQDEDPQFIQMFLDEARLAARLSHANVVQTYEVGQDGPAPYIAMEFLDGQSLNVLQRRAHALKSPIPVNVALRIFCDALEGLHYAHDLKDFDGKPLGVIHRDVTPSNIFVKYEGTTKLVDFGIAKSSTQREKTRAGMLKGKMAYMAPEQFRDAPINRSVDVWAMGIVIWETLAGERLFRGKNDFETVQAVMKREIPKLSSKRSDVPAALDAALAMAIERDPAKRLQTAEELKSKLEEIAFEIGKPLRRTDVAKMMSDLFGEAIEQNAKLVKDFLEKSSTMDNAVVRFKSTGAIEVQAAEDKSETSSSGVETSSPSSTLTNLATQPERQQSTGSITIIKDDKTVVDPRAGELSRAEQDREMSDSDEDEDDEPRPLWHWFALAALLVGLAAVAWKFVLQ